MPVKLPTDIRTASGPLRFVASSAEHGQAIIRVRIVGGGDKLRMILAVTSVHEHRPTPVLMPLQISGRLVAHDDRRQYCINIRLSKMSMLVDEMLYDSNGYWCLYGHVVDHEYIYDGLNLHHLDCCAEYNPSNRMGRLRISLLPTGPEAA